MGLINQVLSEAKRNLHDLGDEAYFQALKQKVNQGRPAYKQVARIVLRDEDFVRNTTKKIVRYKNVPQNRQA